MTSQQADLSQPQQSWQKQLLQHKQQISNLQIRLKMSYPISEFEVMEAEKTEYSDSGSDKKEETKEDKEDE